MDGAEEPSAAHLTALCPSPSVRAFSTSPSVRRPLGAWLAASWPPPERADSTPGSGLIASAHLGCKRRTAHRPQQRGASPGGGRAQGGASAEDPGAPSSLQGRGEPRGEGGVCGRVRGRLPTRLQPPGGCGAQTIVMASEVAAEGNRVGKGAPPTASPRGHQACARRSNSRCPFHHARGAPQEMTLVRVDQN